MSGEAEGHRDAVALFYDDMDALYSAVWGDDRHAGIWSGPGDTASLAEAQRRMTELFVERVALGPGNRLLDVGCGTGAPAARAVETSGCSAVGVTLSRAQAARAAVLAGDSRLSGRLACLIGDGRTLPFKDGSFDGAWALESIFHMGDREAVLREIARVVRPGGRVVLSDLVERSPLDTRQRGVTRALQIASLAPSDAYPGLVEAAGLSCLEVTDLTLAVRRSISETREAMLREHARLRSEYGAELSAAMERLLPELEALYGAKMGYVLVVARR